MAGLFPLLAQAPHAHTTLHSARLHQTALHHTTPHIPPHTTRTTAKHHRTRTPPPPRTMLHDACCAGLAEARALLARAAAVGDAQTTSDLVYEPVTVANTELDGMFCLHALCVRSPGPHHLEVVKLLLTAPATAPLARQMALSTCGEDDWNAAQLAVLHGSLELMQLVLPHAGPEHSWPVFDGNWQRPPLPLLHLLCARLDATTAMLEWLQQWLRCHCVVVPPPTPAMVFAAANVDVVSHLLGRSPPSARRGRAHVALAGAARYNRLPVVVWLLEQECCAAMHEPVQVPERLARVHGVAFLPLLAIAVKFGHSRLVQTLVARTDAATALLRFDTAWLQAAGTGHSDTESDSNSDSASESAQSAVSTAVRLARRWARRRCLFMLRVLRTSGRARALRVGTTANGFARVTGQAEISRGRKQARVAACSSSG